MPPGPGEVLGARWEEIEDKAKTWTIPKGRMKAGRAHVVPLSDAALSILDGMKEAAIGDYIFPGAKANLPPADRGSAVQYILTGILGRDPDTPAARWMRRRHGNIDKVPLEITVPVPKR